MSEVIISRRGYTADGKPELRTEVITSNINWIVPNYKGDSISVRIFGGGEGALNGISGIYGGGNGGCMNNADLVLTPGQSIPITIGAGGQSGPGYVRTSPGPSSFGTYLVANAGLGSGGGGSRQGHSALQFGGGGGEYVGGNGGIWGGGGGAIVSENSMAGKGGTYGGGGGLGCYTSIRGNVNIMAGNGGTYGGGGGGSRGCYNGYENDRWYNYSMISLGGRGGTYGGNGGNQGQRGINGINTSAWTNVDMVNNVYLRGTGVGGTSGGGGGGGGGGFGGRGGNASKYTFNKVDTYSSNYSGLSAGGGGGGYGGNGGDTIDSKYGSTYCGGGGGGGYGGNGGICCGGGGGYGPGADGGNYRGGGGGYFNRGGNNAGGGGGYGRGGENGINAGYAAGGGGYRSDGCMLGGLGICIIQYYA